MHRNTDCSRRTLLPPLEQTSSSHGNIGSLDGHGLSDEPTHINRVRLYPIAHIRALITGMFARNSAKTDEAPTMEGNTPPPREGPGEGYDGHAQR